ncbi:DUF2577 family protein [Clostridium butyricum]|uniref:DUF2577 family protein n=1 Tax=Clostridium butyricum TaxID=1492 RepID=UPI003D13A54E
MKTFGDFFWDSFDKQQNENTRDDPMEIGKVVSLEPLVIEIGGTPINNNRFYINPYLLAWDENVHITTSTASDHNHSISVIHHQPKLQIGSYVYCYGTEYNLTGRSYQKYIVLEVVW